MRYHKLILILFVPFFMGISRLEDIDKSPVGAYKGQVLFGANIAFGVPFGSLIGTEENFTDGLTYTFTDAEVSKTVALNHLSSSVSVFSEYVFRDHFGVRLILSKNTVVQRSAFGRDLNNENRILYSDFSLCIGPVYHLTVRKQFDAAFVPFLGASFGTLYQAPVSAALFEEISQSEKSGTSLTYGLDVSGIYYFNGGFFINTGVSLSFTGVGVKKYTRENPSPAADYNGGRSDALLGNILFYFGGGYALFN